MSLLIIPSLNPLRLYDSASGAEFRALIPKHESDVCYCQKYADQDNITLQLQIATDTYTEVGFQLLDADMNLIGEEPGSIIFSVNNMDYWNLNYLINELEEGIYYARINIAFTEEYGGTKTLLSEPIQIIDPELVTTILIEYTHDQNEFNMLFTGLVDQKYFKIRLEGGFKSEGFTPASVDELYIDQIHDPVLLSSTPFNVHMLTIGDGFGVPNYIIDIINRIFSCSMVTIDSEQYVKNEGAKLQPSRSALYPFSGWTLELLRPENQNMVNMTYILKPKSQQFTGDGVTTTWTISNFTPGPYAKVFRGGSRLPNNVGYEIDGQEIEFEPLLGDGEIANVDE